MKKLLKKSKGLPKVQAGGNLFDRGTQQSTRQPALPQQISAQQSYMAYQPPLPQLSANTDYRSPQTKAAEKAYTRVDDLRDKSGNMIKSFGIDPKLAYQDPAEFTKQVAISYGAGKVGQLAGKALGKIIPAAYTSAETALMKRAAVNKDLGNQAGKAADAWTGINDENGTPFIAYGAKRPGANFPQEFRELEGPDQQWLDWINGSRTNAIHGEQPLLSHTPSAQQFATPEAGAMKNIADRKALYLMREERTPGARNVFKKPSVENYEGVYSPQYQDRLKREALMKEPAALNYRALGTNLAHPDSSPGAMFPYDYLPHKYGGQMQTGGVITDPMGQWAHPGEVTRIPGNNITMDSVPYPVYGVPSSGQPQMMQPGGSYSFPGASHVTEYPMAQLGGTGDHLNVIPMQMGGKPCLECGGQYMQEGGSSEKSFPGDIPSQRKDDFVNWLKQTSLGKIEEEMNENPFNLSEDEQSEMKKGGWIKGAVKHPGRCTPGSPNYDCPKGSPQYNLAQTFKKHHGFHKKKQMGGGADSTGFNDYWNTNPEVLKFKQTFQNRFGEQPSLDPTQSHYDYLSAYKAGVVPHLDPQDSLYHWDSRFKADDHPNRFIKTKDGVLDTKLGKLKKQQIGGYVNSYSPQDIDYSQVSQFNPGNFPMNPNEQGPISPDTPQDVFNREAHGLRERAQVVNQQYPGTVTFPEDYKTPKKNWKDTLWGNPDVWNLGMEAITNIAGIPERHRQEQWLRKQTSADAFNMPIRGSRGDYSTNNGYFRPDQMTPTQFQGASGLYQTGGQYQQGAEVYMDDNEIQQFLAQGGEIDYLD